MRKALIDLNVILDFLSRNGDDFESARLPCFTPEDFLALIHPV